MTNLTANQKDGIMTRKGFSVEISGETYVSAMGEYVEFLTDLKELVYRMSDLWMGVCKEEGNKVIFNDRVVEEAKEEGLLLTYPNIKNGKKFACKKTVMELCEMLSVE
jgi:hypothetical protein